METVRFLVALPFFIVGRTCLFLGCLIVGMPYVEWGEE